jgi:glycosyltransferase involved in cell wall biosynthesis
VIDTKIIERIEKNEQLNNSNIKISFIIPVFNTENYLLKTLDSLVCADIDQIEIIIVDDGSTDESDLLIKEWINKSNVPVIYIRQKNAGLSAARMIGVERARGKFIGFCDSDDWLNVSVYIEMAELASENKCEIAICRSSVFEDDTGYAFDFYDSHIWEMMLGCRHFLNTTLLRKPELLRLEPNANTRLIDKEFFIKNRLEFPYGLHFEDLPVHVKSLILAKRVMLLNRTGYYYRTNRPGKITDQKSEKRFNILTSARIAIEDSKIINLESGAKAYMLLLISRMIYWCGANTLNKDRIRFFKEGSIFIRSNFTKTEITDAMKLGSKQEAILLNVFWCGMVDFLFRYSSGMNLKMFDLIRLITQPVLGRWPRRIAFEKITSKTKSIIFRK